MTSHVQRLLSSQWRRRGLTDEDVRVDSVLCFSGKAFMKPGVAWVLQVAAYWKGGVACLRNSMRKWGSANCIAGAKSTELRKLHATALTARVKNQMARLV